MKRLDLQSFYYDRTPESWPATDGATASQPSDKAICNIWIGGAAALFDLTPSDSPGKLSEGRSSLNSEAFDFSEIPARTLGQGQSGPTVARPHGEGAGRLESTVCALNP